MFRTNLSITWLPLLLLVAGCGYGEVSPKTYEFAKSLYNISNRKMPEKLDDVKSLIDTAVENEEISAKEAKWLNSIVEDAENEKWKKAMASARQIMDDQVQQ